MNHWYTVDLLARDHRGDLDRDAAGSARLKLAHGTAEPRPGAHDPNSGGPRRWLASLGASIQAQWARRRAVSEREAVTAAPGLTIRREP
jgi:hypothetical protein